MEKNKKGVIEGFKAVEFMRKVRNEISKDIQDMNYDQIVEYFKNRRLKLTKTGDAK